MTETTIVHLLRHGEVYNPEGLLYGRLPDYHLSETGVLMAKAAAKWFSGRDVTVLHCSPMERAQETAAPLAEDFGLPVEIDERLIEATNRFEGMKFGQGDASLTKPANLSLMRNPFRPSWGEPYAELAQRMLAAAAAARDAARGHEAVCVSHQLPIWIARRKAEHKRLWHHPAKRQCALASVTSLVYQGDHITEVRYAEPAAALINGPGVPGA
jgi:broad specificity phosphatase PhoE